MSVPSPIDEFLNGYADYDAGRGGAVALGEALLTLNSPAKVQAALALLDWSSERHGVHHADLIQALLSSAERKDRLRPLEDYHLPLLLATPLTPEEAEDLVLDHFEGTYPPGKETQALRFFDVLLARVPEKAVPQALAGIWARGDAMAAQAKEGLKRWLIATSKPGHSGAEALAYQLARITQDKGYGTLSQVRLLQNARHTVPALTETLDRVWPERANVVASWLLEAGIGKVEAWTEARRQHVSGMMSVQMDEIIDVIERFLAEETQGDLERQTAAILRMGQVLQTEMAHVTWAQGWRETDLFHPVRVEERAQALQARPVVAPRPSVRRRT